MKFSEAMKAMEEGKVVRIKGCVSFFVKVGGSPAERWGVIVKDGTPSRAIVFFYTDEVESDAWEIVANPPKQLAERAALGKESKR